MTKMCDTDVNPSGERALPKVVGWDAHVHGGMASIDWATAWSAWWRASSSSRWRRRSRNSTAMKTIATGY
jgi:hypothetical protein